MQGEKLSALRQNPPNQTIYIKNLNEKIKKQDLRHALYVLFSQFGPVIDIVAMRTTQMRGQAFVVFPDIVTAANAMRECQNFLFFEKHMQIQYAKGKSDAVAKLDGTYLPKHLRNQRHVPGHEVIPNVPVDETDEGHKRKAEEVEGEKPAQRRRMETNASPNRVLFVQNLPLDCSDVILIPLFQKYGGFIEVRLVPGGKGMAFVEFQTEAEASRALAELQGFKITLDHPMVISFQKSEQ